MIKIYLLLFILLCSCNGSKEKQIFSHPYWKSGEAKNRIVIALTNNEDVKTQPMSLFIPEELSKKGQVKTLSYGGLETLKSYLDILKDRVGENLILLDTGRFFKSTVAKEKIYKLANFYKQYSYDGILFTEEELIYYKKGEIGLFKDLPFINSNIINLKNKKLLNKKIIPGSRIIERNGLKLGVIGLTSYEGRKVLADDSFKGVYFEKPAVTLLEYKNKLKRQGANFIVLMANLKTTCSSPFSPEKTNYKYKRKHKIKCHNKKDDLLRFLKRIPRDSIDLLILGDQNDSLRGYLLGTPVISTPASTQYLNIIEVNVENEKYQVNLYPKTQLCETFFKMTFDCHIDPHSPFYLERIEAMKGSPLQLKPAMFLGHEIK